MSKVPRNVFFLGLVSFFNDIAAEMVYPIVPIFLTSVVHAPVAIVGLIEGIAEGTASIGKFIFGFLSDKIHKRKIFVVGGYSFSSISKLLIGLATGWPFVLFARFIDRLGKGVRTGARDSILLQNTNSQNKGFIFGFHRAFDSAGAVLGPILALFLMNFLKEDLRTIFFIAFIPSFIGVILLIIFVKEKRSGASKFSIFNSSRLSGIHDAVITQSSQTSSGHFSLNFQSLKIKNLDFISNFKFQISNFNSSLKLFFAISIFFALGNSSDAFLILRAKDLGLTTTLTVAAYMLFNLSQTIFATPLGQLADRIGSRRVFGLGLLIFSLVYFLFGTINNPVFLWLLFPIYGLYIAATDGVSKAYIGEFISEKQSGTYFGLYQTGIAIAGFFASLIGGILWSQFHPSATFFYGSLMALLAFIVLICGKAIKKI